MSEHASDRIVDRAAKAATLRSKVDERNRLRLDSRMLIHRVLSRRAARASAQ
jgi:hypothetical protein